MDNRRHPDRLRRVWAIVEEIAAVPGQSRLQLADKFILSGRQMQADISVIRYEMGLPLVRSMGYRFADDASGPGSLNALHLSEAQLWLFILRGAKGNPEIDPDLLRSLISKLPWLFPPHLRPLVRRTAEAVLRPDRDQAFVAVADAMLSRRFVTLHYPPGSEASMVAKEPTVRPEILLPHLGEWFVLGECRQRPEATLAFPLSTVRAVTPALAAQP